MRHSPANRVPSHGTWRLATAYAIDFVPVDATGRTARIGVATLVRPESPERFPGFGREILSPVAGEVVAVHDGDPDHPAYRGLPSIGYAISQARRARSGWEALAGNHILIAVGDVLVALCHLRRGSIAVVPGQRVEGGEPVASCGNSGNSTEPHLHVQAFVGADPTGAVAVPITFAGALPRDGEVVNPGA